MKSIQIFGILIALCALFSGCSTRSVYEHRLNEEIVEGAPYESSDSEDWEQYFHSNKSKLYSPTLTAIVERALGDQYDSESVLEQLGAMTRSTRLVTETGGWASHDQRRVPVPPCVYFRISLDHHLIIAVRNMAGYVRLGEIGSDEDRIVTFSTSTKP